MAHGESNDSSARYVQDVPRSPLINSISQNGENTTQNLHDVYGTDIMLDIPTRSDIAPVQEKIDPFEDIPIRADAKQSEVWDGTEESWEAYMKQSEEEYLSTLVERCTILGGLFNTKKPSIKPLLVQ